MATFKDLEKFFDGLDKNFLRLAVPHIVAEKATEFYKKRFELKADVHDRPWEPAKYPPTRGSLMVRSGNLMASIRPAQVTPGKVVISAGSSKVPYARLHNNGGRVVVPVTKKLRKYAWAMHYQTGEDRWKGLAITSKKSIWVRIPRRQFMGHSNLLNEVIKASISAAFKQFLNSNKT